MRKILLLVSVIILNIGAVSAYDYNSQSNEWKGIFSVLIDLCNENTGKIDKALCYIDINDQVLEAQQVGAYTKEKSRVLGVISSVSSVLIPTNDVYEVSLGDDSIDIKALRIESRKIEQLGEYSLSSMGLEKQASYGEEIRENTVRDLGEYKQVLKKGNIEVIEYFSALFDGGPANHMMFVIDIKNSTINKFDF